jgi:hypothetical protein
VARRAGPYGREHPARRQRNQDALPGSKFCYRHDYRAEDSEFTGTVDSVLLEIAEGATDFNHLVDPQLRLSMALARQ